MTLSRTEIDLRRLLYKCDIGIQSGLAEDHLGRKKLLHFVHDLRGFLSQLERERGDIASEKARFLELSRRIDRLEAMLDVEKMSVPVLAKSSHNSLVETAFISHSELNRASQSELVVKSRKQTRVRDQLFNSMLSPKQEDEMAQRNELFNSEYNSTNNSTRYDEQKKINTERILQEQLTDEMVKMAQYLKQNALGIERITKNDQEVLSENERLIESNVNTIQRENVRLKQFTSKSSSTTIMIWIMILVVLCLFITTFILIRIFPKQKF